MADQTATVQMNIVNKASRSTIHPESGHNTSGTPKLDKHVRIAILVKSRRCLDGNDTACSLQESLAALDDATAILKPFSQLRAVCVTDASMIRSLSTGNGTISFLIAIFRRPFV